MYIVEIIDDKSHSIRLNDFTDEAVKTVLRTGKSRWHHKELLREIHKLSYSPLFECTIEPQDLPSEKGLLLETLQRLEKFVRPSATLSSNSKADYVEYYDYHTVVIKEQK